LRGDSPTGAGSGSGTASGSASGTAAGSASGTGGRAGTASTFNVSISSAFPGAVPVPNTVQQVNAGGTQSYSVTAATGYTLSSTVTGTCPAGSWSGATYTTGAIVANCTVSFRGTLRTYSVSASGTGVSIAPATPQVITAFNAASFTVTPDPGQAVAPAVGGTCPTGAWTGSVYATGPVLANCTVSFSSGTVSWAGARLLGVANKSTIGAGLAVDADQNVYVTGETEGNLDGNTKSTSLADAYLTKYDELGVKQWTRLLGANLTGGRTSARGAAVDSNGNIFIAGYTRVALPGNSLNGNADLFLAKYDSDGTRLWVRQLGQGGQFTFGSAVAVDGDGNAIVVGNAGGDLDGQSSIGNDDGFVVKYDGNGTRLWTRLVGVTNKLSQIEAVKCDSSNNVVVAGKTNGNMDGNTLTGNEDLLIVKYDANGTRLWTRQLGVAAKLTSASGVTTDASRNVIVTGKTDGALSGNVLTGSEDYLVAKYNANGTMQWVRQQGVSSKFTEAAAVSVGASGDVYVTGETSGALDGQPSANGNDKLFLARYNTAGTRQWTRLVATDTSGHLSGAGVSVASDGVYVLGTAQNGAGVGGVPAPGVNNAYTGKFDFTGVRQ